MLDQAWAKRIRGGGRGLDRKPIKVDKRGKENPIKEGFNQKLFGNNIGFSVSKKGLGRRGGGGEGVDKGYNRDCRWL